MENQEFSKRAVRKQLRSEVKKGRTKQDIYQEYIEKYDDREFIANALEKIPSMEKRRKNRVLLAALISILSMFTLMDLTFNLVTFIMDILEKKMIDLLVSLSVITRLAVDITFLLIVIRYRIRFYNWIILWGVFITIINAFPFFHLLNEKSTPERTFEIYVHLVFFALTILTVILGFLLSTKLSSPYIEKKERYTKTDGTKGIRALFIFED